MGSTGVGQLLCQKYRRIWSQAAESVREGSYRADPDPIDGGLRWGLSLVALLPPHVGDYIAGELAELASRMNGRHFVYHRDALHVTVRSLEGYEAEVPTEIVGFYASRMRRAVADLKPVNLEFRGLSGTSGGIFACGYADQTIADLRLKLHRESDFQRIVSEDTSRIRDTFHSSLVVFKDSDVPEPELADYVQLNQDKDLGSGRLEQLALVRYHWHAGTARREILDTVDL